LVLGFVFGFDDGQKTLIPLFWLKNFITITIIVAASLLIRELGHKIVAKTYNSSAEYQIWATKRFWISERAKLPLKFFGFKVNSIKLGIILPLLFAFISLGKIPFAIAGTFKIIVNKIHRVGRRYSRLTELEEGKIALAGPITNVLLAIFLKFISITFLINLNTAIKINLFIALFNMLPIPNVDGGRIFFGNKGMYIFNLVFILVCLILLQTVGIFLTIVLALTFAALITLNYVIIKYKY